VNNFEQDKQFSSNPAGIVSLSYFCVLSSLLLFRILTPFGFGAVVERS
jgi:hypothetical protein